MDEAAEWELPPPLPPLSVYLLLPRRLLVLAGSAAGVYRVPGPAVASCGGLLLGFSPARSLLRCGGRPVCPYGERRRRTVCAAEAGMVSDATVRGWWGLRAGPRRGVKDSLTSLLG